MIDLGQVSQALRGATRHSLIIMDEFGKGMLRNLAYWLIVAHILQVLILPMGLDFWQVQLNIFCKERALDQLSWPIFSEPIDEHLFNRVYILPQRTLCQQFHYWRPTISAFLPHEDAFGGWLRWYTIPLQVCPIVSQSFDGEILIYIYIYILNAGLSLHLA